MNSNPENPRKNEESKTNRNSSLFKLPEKRKCENWPTEIKKIKKVDATSNKFSLHFDGGSRGNPGISGSGYIIKSQTDTVVQGCVYIGVATNNQAEYTGLIEGLKQALSLGVKNIDIYGDSQLIIRQLSKEYKCKKKTIRPLYKEAKKLLKNFENKTLNHVLREYNKEADLLANQAMDTCTSNVHKPLKPS